MFSIFTYVMSRVTHSEPGLPMVHFLQNLPAKRQFWFKTNFSVFRTSKKKSWAKFE